MLEIKTSMYLQNRGYQEGSLDELFWKTTTRVHLSAASERRFISPQTPSTPFAATISRFGFSDLLLDQRRMHLRLIFHQGPAQRQPYQCLHQTKMPSRFFKSCTKQIFSDLSNTVRSCSSNVTPELWHNVIDTVCLRLVIRGYSSARSWSA